MGKHIIHVSVWSQRSLFSAFSKLMTLIFALFCAATGQLSKNAAEQRADAASTTFKGTAYNAADSSVLSSIRLILQDCYMPDYGISPYYGITPDYGVSTPVIRVVGQPILDTVVTDEHGKFATELPGTGNWYFGVSSDGSTEPSGITAYISPCMTVKAGTDSTYSLYLKKLITTAGRESKPSAPPAVMSTFQGKMLHIRIPQWRHQQNVASIVNSRGQNVTMLTAAADGSLSWDTRSVAKGMYFLKLDNGQTSHRLKILVN